MKKKSMGKTKPTNPVICVIPPSFNWPDLYLDGSGLCFTVPRDSREDKAKGVTSGRRNELAAIVGDHGNPSVLC